MLFNSYIFVLVFLPICVIGYFLCNRINKINAGLVFLLGMSLWFYGYFNITYLPLIIGSVCVNYILYRLIIWSKNFHKKNNKVFLIIGIIFNLGLLGIFKYTDFLIETVGFLSKRDYVLTGIVLPLGISFFTFQQISFLVDVYRDGKKINYNWLSYACYVTFFPQLIAGPIVTHNELIPQFFDWDKKRFNWDNFAAGIYLFTMGLAKKVLIADPLGNLVNKGFSDISVLDSTNALIVMVSYTLQIYFDFSGYCDMAMGIGKMLNIELPENFNSPYKAKTIVEFWERWHMTLTRFFTKYLYIPMGGNRKGTAKTYLNIFIVFLLSGLWHGAGWQFIFWGGCHGAFIILTRSGLKIFNKIPFIINWIITFLFVNLTWVFFRSDSISSGFKFMSRIFSFKFGPINDEIAVGIQGDLMQRIVPNIGIPSWTILSLLLVFYIFIVLAKKNSVERTHLFDNGTLSKGKAIYLLFFTVVLFVWSLLSFSGVSTFIYFNF